MSHGTPKSRHGYMHVFERGHWDTSPYLNSAFFHVDSFCIGQKTITGSSRLSEPEKRRRLFPSSVNVLGWVRLGPAQVACPFPSQSRWQGNRLLTTKDYPSFSWRPEAAVSSADLYEWRKCDFSKGKSGCGRQRKGEQLGENRVTAGTDS